MTHKMTTISIFLGVLMEDILVSNLNNTVIVTVKRSTRVLRQTHVLEKLMNPNKLRSSVNKSMIFGFGTRANNNSLLLIMPRNKKVTQ